MSIHPVRAVPLQVKAQLRRSVPEPHPGSARLLRDEIRAHSRTNVVQERTYTQRLLESLRKYHNRAIETAQVMVDDRDAKDFKENLERHKELGLSTDGIAFYDALAA